MQRLPPQVREALPESLDVEHYALNLWQRSAAGPASRVLLVSEGAAAAIVLGETTVVQAAELLAKAGLLKELKPVEGSRIWQWMVDGGSTEFTRTNVSPLAAGKFTAAERADILASRSR